MKSGIYKITNTVNGKCYVGSTNNFSRRWAEHKKKMRYGTSSCTRLQAAWIKYGGASFEFTVLEHVTCLEVLAEREQFWIDLLCPEYNVSPAAGSQAGYRHSAETRALLSRINRISPEQREKMVAGIRAMSQEAKAACSAKQSAAHKGNTRALGHVQSSESRVKKSVALKGRVFSDEHRAKLRANHWRKKEVAA